MPRGEPQDGEPAVAQGLQQLPVEGVEGSRDRPGIAIDRPVRSGDAAVDRQTSTIASSPASMTLPLTLRPSRLEARVVAAALTWRSSAW